MVDLRFCLRLVLLSCLALPVSALHGSVSVECSAADLLDSGSSVDSRMHMLDSLHTSDSRIPGKQTAHLAFDSWHTLHSRAMLALMQRIE